MSDYKEIVRRLRGQAKQDGHTEYEAADAIERLSAEVERLKQERDEALAARETYAMTARQDIIEKAKALDELAAWLRSGADWRSADLQAAGADAFGVQLDEGGCVEACEDAPNLAAAIMASLKASGQGGK